MTGESSQDRRFGTQEVINPAVTLGDMVKLYYGLRREFADWLAAVGYGVEFRHETDPPIQLHELAEAYMRLEPYEGETLEDYKETILESTGAYLKEASL